MAKKLRYWIAYLTRERYSFRNRVKPGGLALRAKLDDRMTVKGWGWEGDRFVVHVKDQ